MKKRVGLIFGGRSGEHEVSLKKYLIDKLKDINKPVILVLNKIDKVKREDILRKILLNLHH